MKSKEDAKGATAIPHLSLTRFLQKVEERTWTEAEKELDTIRQKAENSQWSRGYVKALEGLLLTNRNNDDKYSYLPKVLETRSENTIESLKKEFAEFASNELHGEYDRGYFKALEEYLTQVATFRRPAKQNTQTLLPLGEKPAVKAEAGAESGEEYSE